MSNNNSGNNSITGQLPFYLPGNIIYNNIPIQTWVGQTVTIQGCNIQGDLGGGIQLDLPLEEECKGCSCSKCAEFNEYAQPNQPDKKSFICYSCRTPWA